MKIPGQSDFYKEDDTIFYVASEPKCFDLFVTDDVGTNVTLSAEAVSFDGGINNETIGLASEAGADTFVAGSAIFNTENYEQTISELRSKII